jgi:hypothetical protein
MQKLRVETELLLYLKTLGYWKRVGETICSITIIEIQEKADLL